ncbi:MAG: OmpA family protein [Desulfococcaceae bacterium]|jgi:chemotaxis protein MotB|nr:OmpA family protein [Desulfococcaceae bacterium]
MAKIEKKEIIEEGAPEWVTTFGDLMSLLLCFFVLLLSFSEMDRQKYKIMTGSMARAFGVQKKRQVMGIPMGDKIIARDFDQEAVMLQLKEDLAREIKNEVEVNLKNMKDLVDVKAEKGKVVIRLMGETTFPSGRADIRREMVPVLMKIGKLLNKNKSRNIIIGGHTDNIPIRGGMYHSNLVLSMARAAEVAEFLIREAGISPQQIATMGFGEYRPIESNEKPEGRQKNRRVEIIISSTSYRSRKPVAAEEQKADMSAPREQGSGRK